METVILWKEVENDGLTTRFFVKFTTYISATGTGVTLAKRWRTIETGASRNWQNVKSWNGYTVKDCMEAYLKDGWKLQAMDLITK